MTEKDFIEDMEDLMDTEVVLTMDTQLNDIEEWDSLSRVAFMAYCATHGSHRATPSEIKNVETVRGLYEIVEG